MCANTVVSCRPTQSDVSDNVPHRVHSFSQFITARMSGPNAYHPSQFPYNFAVSRAAKLGLEL